MLLPSVRLTQSGPDNLMIIEEVNNRSRIESAGKVDNLFVHTKVKGQKKSAFQLKFFGGRIRGIGELGGGLFS